MSAKRQKLDSYSENANAGLTIFDAPNVCREIMAKCELLARQVENECGNAAIAIEVRSVGEKAERMLDAIVASTDQILAMEAQK